MLLLIVQITCHSLRQDWIFPSMALARLLVMFRSKNLLMVTFWWLLAMYLRILVFRVQALRSLMALLVFMLQPVLKIVQVMLF